MRNVGAPERCTKHAYRSGKMTSGALLVQQPHSRLDRLLVRAFFVCSLIAR